MAPPGSKSRRVMMKKRVKMIGSYLRSKQSLKLIKGAKEELIREGRKLANEVKEEMKDELKKKAEEMKREVQTMRNQTNQMSLRQMKVGEFNEEEENGGERKVKMKKDGKMKIVVTVGPEETIVEEIKGEKVENGEGGDAMEEDGEEDMLRRLIETQADMLDEVKGFNVNAKKILWVLLKQGEIKTKENEMSKKEQELKRKIDLEMELERELRKKQDLIEEKEKDLKKREDQLREDLEGIEEEEEMETAMREQGREQMKK